MALEGLAVPWVGSSPPNYDNLGICQSAPEYATATTQDDANIYSALSAILGYVTVIL